MIERNKFLTNQKRYPNLSSDPSSVWNFCKNLALYLLASVAQAKLEKLIGYVLIQRKRLKNCFALFLTKHVLMMRRLLVQLKHQQRDATLQELRRNKSFSNSYLVKINFKSMVRKAIVKVWIWSLKHLCPSRMAEKEMRGSYKCLPS